MCKNTQTIRNDDPNGISEQCTYAVMFHIFVQLSVRNTCSGIPTKSDGQARNSKSECTGNTCENSVTKIRIFHVLFRSRSLNMFNSCCNELSLDKFGNKLSGNRMFYRIVVFGFSRNNNVNFRSKRSSNISFL